MVHRLATVAVGCRPIFIHNTQRKPNRQNFRVWNSHAQHSQVAMAIPARNVRRFGFVAFLATATLLL